MCNPPFLNDSLYFLVHRASHPLLTFFTVSIMHPFELLGYVFIFVNWAIICPFCIYYSILYFKKVKERHILQLRYPWTLKYNLIIICYFLLIEQTITLIETFDIVPEIPSMLTLYITLPTYSLVFYSGIVRSWLLYYHQQISSRSTQLKRHSSHSTNNIKTQSNLSCFHAHSNTLGNHTGQPML